MLPFSFWRFKVMSDFMKQYKGVFGVNWEAIYIVSSLLGNYTGESRLNCTGIAALERRGS